MRTDSAYGHARPPHPRRFAVLVYAGGCWFPGCFWRWPVAVYARSRVTAAHSVPVCTVETAQGRAHWARPCASGFVRVFWHMCVAVCAGWGALRGTGVDAHAVRAHAVRACVLDCADCPGSSGTHSGPVRACFLGTCAWLCAGWGICGTGAAALFLRALQLWYALLSMVAFLSAEGMVLWSGCYRSHATLKRDGS